MRPQILIDNTMMSDTLKYSLIYRLTAKYTYAWNCGGFLICIKGVKYFRSKKLVNTIYDKAGARIRDLRETNRYTREQFAEIVDISPKFLYEIETGQKGFSADTLFRISKGLSVTCEYILSGENRGVHSDEIFDALGLYNSSQMNDISKLLKQIHELSIKFIAHQGALKSKKIINNNCESLKNET